MPWDWAEFHFKATQEQEGSWDERGQSQEASRVLVTQQASPNEISSARTLHTRALLA